MFKSHLAAVFVLCSDVTAGDPWSQRTAPSMKAAHEAIHLVSNLKSDSYHKLIRNAAMIAEPLLKNQNWDDVQILVKELKLPRDSIFSNGSRIHGRWILNRNAHRLSDNSTLELQLLLGADNVDPKGKAPKWGALNEANIALIAKFGRPFRDVVSSRPFAKGTAGALLLDAPETREAGAKWPLLKEIELTYGPFIDRWQEHNSIGICAEVRFTASISEEVAEKHLSCFIPSNLDPMFDWEKKDVPDKDFKAQDRLGEVRCYGGGAWWKGTLQQRAANRKRFGIVDD